MRHYCWLKYFQSTSAGKTESHLYSKVKKKKNIFTAVAHIPVKALLTLTHQGWGEDGRADLHTLTLERHHTAVTPRPEPRQTDGLVEIECVLRLCSCKLCSSGFRVTA